MRSQPSHRRPNVALTHPVHPAAQAYFQQTNKDGVSLHSHLAELIQELLTSKDPDALSKLESISLDVKAKHFKPAMGVTPVAPNIEDDGWKKRSNALFQAATGEEDTGVPNVVEIMSFFEFAGVGLAREESFRLFLAMGGLKAAYDLKSVRFFGKILGTKKDYYVVEGEYKTAPAAPTFEGEGTAPEAPGTGLNKCAYFVANGVSDPFELLPDVTPAQVLASSTIKKYFSGDLSAPLACYPPFPGGEKEYLRAQIARISAATVLVPAGKLALEEVEEGPAPIIPVAPRVTGGRGTGASPLPPSCPPMPRHLRAVSHLARGCPAPVEASDRGVAPHPLCAVGVRGEHHTR